MPVQDRSTVPRTGIPGTGSKLTQTRGSSGRLSLPPSRPSKELNVPFTCWQTSKDETRKAGVSWDRVDLPLRGPARDRTQTLEGAHLVLRPTQQHGCRPVRFGLCRTGPRPRPLLISPGPSWDPCPQVFVARTKRTIE